MKDEADNATIDLEDHLKGMHRVPDHETSIKAARGVRRFTLREQVIQFAYDCGRGGFTDDSLKVVWHDRPESSFRKRRTELAQENIIVESGFTAKNRQGQDEKVWVHRDFHPSPPPIQERDTSPKQSKLARLEARVADLEDIVALAFPLVEEHYDFVRSSDENPYDNAGMQRIDALARRMKNAVSN